ncbi:MAG TPA: nucleotidyltransferase family protein [Terriglobales bacterium]|nr:nucleotidyltransferase family protein [Terriglobales bacterium]
MKAMILAAGLGTRLRPLTNDRPKALVEVGGKTMLEITLARLHNFGIREIIINVHHFANMIQDYLRARKNFGMRIEISREDDLLLDTGGGLKQAGWFFQQASGRDEPFLLHNVDVISNIDFSRMLGHHKEKQGLATVAVQDRETSRYLLFDKSLELCGRKFGRNGKSEIVRPARDLWALAFSGIHIISPRLISRMTENGAFSIIDTYLRLAAEGEKIVGFRADQYFWRDLGKPEQIAQAAADIAAGQLTVS